MLRESSNRPRTADVTVVFRCGKLSELTGSVLGQKDLGHAVSHPVSQRLVSAVVGNCALSAFCIPGEKIQN